MCSTLRLPRAARLMVATLALLVAAPGARLLAQGAPESTAEYRQLVERLAERWRRQTRADSLENTVPGSEPSPRFDTLRFGTLVLIAPPPRLGLAAAIGRAAWDSIKTQFGADTLVLLPDTIGIGGRRARRLASFPETGSPREYQEAYGLSMILGDVAGAEIARFARNGDEERWRWGTQWLPSALGAMLFASDSIQRVTTYMELATQPWAVVRACFGGDLDACYRALSLPSTPDSVASLFTPAERRRLVSLHARSGTDLARAPGTTRCLEAGVDSACVDLFRRFEGVFYERPLSAEARATLLRTAADLGGDGWYTRLLAAPQPDYLARLAAVAQMSPQELLQAWRTRIMSARPAPMTLPRLSGWIAFLWAGVFAVMATRSSRWRRD